MNRWSRSAQLLRQQAAPPCLLARATCLALGALALSAASVACGSDSGGGSGGSATSGGTSSGGTPATGGAPATGGTSVSGGGGSQATGGTSPTTGGTSPTTGGTLNPTGGSGAGAGGSGAGQGGGSGGGNGGVSGSAQGGAGGTGGGAGGGAPVSCPSPALQPGDSNKTVMVGADSRSYVLHVPAQYDGSKAVPLVVDFHPLGGSGPSERSGSPYPAQTDAEGVIMAFPSGKSGPSGGAWNVGPCCVKDVNDVEFAKALVAQIKQSACIDPKRVYAVGFSMGGGMSHYLACHAADVFAAVAPAAFDLLKENVDDCTPPRPISVVSFRSTSDPVVPYAGGYSSVVQGMPINFLGAKATFEKWSQINHCSGAASAEDANGCASYSGCQGGVDVVLCTKQGGGHDPGNAQVAWPILKKHVLP